MSEDPGIALRVGVDDYALEPGRVYVLGSGDHCDLQLRHDSVATHHVRVQLAGGGAMVDNLAGVGTTRCNGLPVEQALLQAGDVLQLGAIAIAVVRDGGTARILPDPFLVARARRERGGTARPHGFDSPPPLEPVARKPALAEPSAAPAAPASAAPAAKPAEPQRPPHRRRLGAAALPLRDQHEATFADLMADELRRTPWLGLSLVLHALLLLLLWWLLPTTTVGGRQTAQVGIDAAEGMDAELPEPAVPIEVFSELDPPDPTLQDVPTKPDEPEALDQAAPEPASPWLKLSSNPTIRNRQPSAGGAGDGNDPLAGEHGGTSSGFRATVGQLRRTGLEIVFVVDSTGSMSSTIEATKTSIAEMLAVLRALVPDARFGFVAYRDRGATEAYLTQELPLGRDFWRATNFMQFLTAAGGGDRPEDVLAGLQAAFDQIWRPGARRVVVLAGDAPPHDEQRKALSAAVRQFASDGRSHVHAIVTGPPAANADTRQAFARITKDGRGECVDAGQQETLLRRVLGLAFGAGFEGDIAKIYQQVLATREPSGRLRDLVRAGGKPLARELGRDVIDDALVRALLEQREQRLVLQLLELLADRNQPEPGRQAIGHVLQQHLALPVPPVDPVRGGPPPAAELRALRAAALALPR